MVCTFSWSLGFVGLGVIVLQSLSRVCLFFFVFFRCIYFFFFFFISSILWLFFLFSFLWYFGFCFNVFCADVQSGYTILVHYTPSLSSSLYSYLYTTASSQPFLTFPSSYEPVPRNTRSLFCIVFLISFLPCLNVHIPYITAHSLYTIISPAAAVIPTLYYTIFAYCPFYSISSRLAPGPENLARRSGIYALCFGFYLRA